MSGVITGAEYITSGPNVGKISIAKTFDNKTITEIVNPSFYLLSGKSIKENPFFLKALSSRHAAKAQSAWTDFGKNFFRQRSATAANKIALRLKAVDTYKTDVDNLLQAAQKQIPQISKTNIIEHDVLCSEIADMLGKAADMTQRLIDIYQFQVTERHDNQQQTQKDLNDAISKMALMRDAANTLRNNAQLLSQGQNENQVEGQTTDKQIKNIQPGNFKLTIANQQD